MPLAALGVGSNLGDAAANVERALRALGSLGEVVRRSSLYRTEPWGVREQPPFVNAAALLATDLTPHALLAALKGLEAELGREPGSRWGPRAIDLDILTYGDVAISEPELTIPHARLAERAFALAPLAEIDLSHRAAWRDLPLAERRGVQRIRTGTARSGSAVDWDETLARVRAAAEFCASAGLARFRIDEDDFAVDVRRRLPLRPAVALEPPGDPAEAPNGRSSTNGAVHEEQRPSVLRAEFVGIVRLSRPSVSQGTSVSNDRELAYVESLGIRNPIRSGGPGKIADVFVTDGDAVEYGQPLFSIER